MENLLPLNLVELPAAKIIAIFLLCGNSNDFTTLFTICLLQPYLTLQLYILNNSLYEYLVSPEMLNIW